MALSYRVRDARQPRQPFLDEAGIAQGANVLDFGCGPGSYTVPAARMVGQSGNVFALDVHPEALRITSERASKAGLSNVHIIRSDCGTALPDGSVDVALLYDVYHDLEDPGAVLAELHRVLKPAGILSSHDHHLKTERLREAIESSGLFRVTHQGTLTITCAPERKTS